MQVTLEADGKTEFLPKLPGTTRADLTLHKDAVRYAVQALNSVPGGREANCTIVYVADTEFLEEAKVDPVAGGKGPPWKES